MVHSRLRSHISCLLSNNDAQLDCTPNQPHLLKVNERALTLMMCLDALWHLHSATCSEITRDRLEEEERLFGCAVPQFFRVCCVVAPNGDDGAACFEEVGHGCSGRVWGTNYPSRVSQVSWVVVFFARVYSVQDALLVDAEAIWNGCSTRCAAEHRPPSHSC